MNLRNFESSSVYDKLSREKILAFLQEIDDQQQPSKKEIEDDEKRGKKGHKCK